MNAMADPARITSAAIVNLIFMFYASDSENQRVPIREGFKKGQSTMNSRN
jgi:hypothetical protein